MKDPLVLVWPLLITGAAVVALIWVAVKISSWFHEDNDPAASAHEMLAQYREMQRQGELTDEEFRSIKGRLAGQIGETAGSRSAGDPKQPPLEPGEQKSLEESRD